MPPAPDRLYKVLRLRREKGWLGVLSPRALRVDDALLEHYNWLKGCAYPGYERLRRDTGLSRDAVSEALRELEFCGRWVIHRTRRRPNIYCLPPELVPDVPAARYVPSARWTRKERLASLSESRASRPSSRGGHAVSSRGVSTGTTQLTTQELRNENYGKATPFFNHLTAHSPNGEKPRKEEAILRHRSFWLSSGCVFRRS